MPTFEEAVLQIYRGLLDADGVRSSLKAVADFLGGHVAALHDEDRSLGVGRVIASGLPERQFAEFVVGYQQRWAEANPWMEASMDALLREGVEHGDAVVNRQELESSDYYKQLLRPLNIEHSLGLRVAMSPPSRIAVATINRARCAGPFDGDSKRLALGLRPHLECAYLLHRRLAGC